METGGGGGVIVRPSPRNRKQAKKKKCWMNVDAALVRRIMGDSGGRNFSGAWKPRSLNSAIGDLKYQITNLLRDPDGAAGVLVAEHYK